MTDEHWSRTTWPDSPPPSPPPSMGERLAVVARDLTHLVTTSGQHGRRLDRLEERVDVMRQEALDERRDRLTRDQIKLQEKEARKAAVSTGLALLSVAMFAMAAVNFANSYLARPPAPPPASAKVLR
jgi:hypothetical protein